MRNQWWIPYWIGIEMLHSSLKYTHLYFRRNEELENKNVCKYLNSEKLAQIHHIRKFHLTYSYQNIFPAHVRHAHYEVEICQIDPVLLVCTNSDLQIISGVTVYFLIHNSQTIHQTFSLFAFINSLEVSLGINYYY